MTPTEKAHPVSPTLQAEAESLRARSQSGEEIPLDTLRAFILRANQTLITQRREAEKPSDVDFF